MLPAWVLLAAALMSGAFAAPDPPHLVYALPATETVSISYIALEKGFFKEEGLEVEGKMFSSGREGLQALLAGQAQIQSVSETPIVHAIIQGNKVMTVATVSRHKEAKLIARRDHGISRPEDARGKKLATLPGTNSDYFMYEFFNKYKIAPGEVKIANMPPPEMVVAFAKGDIDGYFAWEPHIYYGQQQLGKEAIVFPPGDLYKGFNTVNMDPAFVKAHPEIVGKILKALLKGEDFLNQHPDEALAIVCNRLKVEPAVGKALWKETIYRVELDRDLPETMEKIGRWAKTKDNVSGELPHFRDFLYPDALRSIDRSRVRL